MNGLLCLGFLKGQYWDHHYIMHLSRIYFSCGDIHIAKLSDDNTPYIFTTKVDNIMEAREQVIVPLFKRLHHNLLKGNTDKYNFLVSNDEEVTLNVDTFALKNCEYEKLLRV